MSFILMFTYRIFAILKRKNSVQSMLALALKSEVKKYSARVVFQPIRTRPEAMPF